MGRAARECAPGVAVVWDCSAEVWLVFDNPVEIVETLTLDSVVPCLEHVDRAVEDRGLHAVGIISYEAAPALDGALVTHDSDGFPLVWFALCPPPTRVATLPVCSGAASWPDRWTRSVTREQFDAAIDVIRRAIGDGLTYQVNYTHRLRAPFAGSPWALFTQAVAGHRPDHAAFLDLGRYALCSMSPELFLRRDGRRLVSTPMKGTVARGRFPAEDAARASWLRDSEKNRAENIMIVDMARNDLGRVAQTGSVRVERLFDIERLPAVWQMTSTVAAQTDASFADVLRAAFPAASITGAPKVSTMRLIRELEPGPRRAYTGSVAWLAPGRHHQLSVAIRTIIVDRTEARAEYGVGGGIVWDSEAADEFAECEHKARVLAAPAPTFELVETVKWEPGDGYASIDAHLHRLAASADYFGFTLDQSHVMSELAASAARLTEPSRVRVRAARDGSVLIDVGPLPPRSLRPLRLRLARRPVASSDVFLFHKTTRREVYDTARADVPDADDVVLWNERRELTETTIGNLVVRLDGTLVTPPVECGLLAGTYRARLLDAGEVVERIVPVDRLLDCTEAFRVNALRGLEPATLEACPC